MKTRTAVKAIAVALLLAVTTPAWAERGDVYLDTTLTALHFPRERARKEKLNEQNFGFGVAYGLFDYMDLKGGGYHNTYNKPTIYVGANVKHAFHLLGGNWFAAPGLMIGVATGYGGTPVDDQVTYGLRPMVLPNVQIGHKAMFATVGILPALNDTHYTTLTFQLTFKLGNIRGK